jgi:hypothetical protein
MSTSPCAVAADTKVETPEGPLPIRSLATTPAAVLTRTDAGLVRFAMIRAVRKADAAEPVVRITLDNGLAFRVGPGQVVLKKGMVETPAGALRVGDELEPIFSFPEGYTYRTDDQREVVSRASTVVTSIEPGGEAEVFSFSVNLTGRFALSCGVLAKADGA